jgi:endonuclease YncB( thermonuclease family)
MFACVTLLSTYDGDTFKVKLDDKLPAIFKTMSVRVRGINAPEITSKEPCEKAIAIAAKKVLETTLSNAKCINLLDVKPDKYFRLLATVQADGVDVRYLMISKHMAVKYDGGKRTSSTCKTL